MRRGRHDAILRLIAFFRWGRAVVFIGAAGLFAYAALFTIEGTGLWLGKRGGEWLTIVATTSFIPFEVYELWHRASVLKAGLLAVNVVIVIYLM